MQSDRTVLCFVKLSIYSGKHDGRSAKLKLQVGQKNPQCVLKVPQSCEIVSPVLLCSVNSEATTYGMSVTWEYVHLTKLQSETFSIKPPLLGAKRGGTESFALFSLYTRPAFSKDCMMCTKRKHCANLLNWLEKNKKNYYLLCTS